MLTALHAQLLASKSMCSPSCTNSCQGRYRTISSKPAKVRWLVGNHGSNENSNPDKFWWSGIRQKSLAAVGNSMLSFFCSYQVLTIRITFLFQPNLAVLLVFLFLNQSRDSIFEFQDLWSHISSIRSHPNLSGTTSSGPSANYHSAHYSLPLLLLLLFTMFPPSDSLREAQTGHHKHRPGENSKCFIWLNG